MTGSTREMIRRWFGESGWESERVAGGLSGGVIHRICDVRGQSWALRQWPEGISRERFEWIQRAVGCAIEGGFDLAPEPRCLADGSACVAWAGNRGWDCRRWLAGTPMVLESELESFAAALIRADACWMSTVEAGAGGPAGQRTGEVPAVEIRCRRLRELAQLELGDRADWERSGRESGISVDVLERAARVFGESRLVFWRRAESELAQFGSGVGIAGIGARLDLTVVLGDLHFGNGLYRGGELVGIVDFGAVRWDTAAADLARLLGSWEWEVGSERWLTESVRAWDVVLAGFREVRPFSAEEERLVRVLTRWTPLITLGNWLQWLIRDRRRFTGTAEELSARLQRWTRVVVARLEGQLGFE